MPYTLKEITIRTNNSVDGIKKIDELFQDIANGKYPLQNNSDNTTQNDQLLISKYHNYENDEKGDYDFSVIGTKSDFIDILESGVKNGMYVKYTETDKENNIGECCRTAWSKVWEDQANNKIKRVFKEDFQIAVPAEFSPNGECFCCLYISVDI